ncbi:hypothetical protein P781_15230 [Vibrio mimicus CAIM 1883]|nr:hypothetical protein P780_15220 [Vibrio mimicus CAIM 1882]ERM54023.1 hypothetical protein P781_15230 [Vibrio mimicus CAIM 1883]
MYEIVYRVSWDKLYHFDNFIDALSFNLEESFIFSVSDNEIVKITVE